MAVIVMELASSLVIQTTAMVMIDLAGQWFLSIRDNSSDNDGFCWFPGSRETTAVIMTDLAGSVDSSQH